MEEIVGGESLSSGSDSDSTEAEAKENLTSFFSLLLEIDRRQNPNLYRKGGSSFVPN